MEDQDRKLQELNLEDIMREFSDHPDVPGEEVE